MEIRVKMHESNKCVNENVQGNTISCKFSRSFRIRPYVRSVIFGKEYPRLFIGMHRSVRNVFGCISISGRGQTFQSNGFRSWQHSHWRTSWLPHGLCTLRSWWKDDTFFTRCFFHRFTHRFVIFFSYIIFFITVTRDVNFSKNLELNT